MTLTCAWHRRRRQGRTKVSKALRTRHSSNSLSKKNIPAWSSRFSSLYSVSPRSFTLYIYSLYQLPAVGPTRQIFYLFLFTLSILSLLLPFSLSSPRRIWTSAPPATSWRSRAPAPGAFVPRHGSVAGEAWAGAHPIHPPRRGAGREAGVAGGPRRCGTPPWPLPPGAPWTPARGGARSRRGSPGKPARGGGRAPREDDAGVDCVGVGSA